MCSPTSRMGWFQFLLDLCGPNSTPRLLFSWLTSLQSHQTQNFDKQSIFGVLVLKVSRWNSARGKSLSRRMYQVYRTARAVKYQPWNRTTVNNVAILSEPEARHPDILLKTQWLYCNSLQITVSEASHRKTWDKLSVLWGTIRNPVPEFHIAGCIHVPYLSRTIKAPNLLTH